MEMEAILSNLLKQLVRNPDEIEVRSESNEEGHVTLFIDAHEEDVPLIIGRSGRTIKALRNLLSIKAVKEDVRVHLKVTREKDEEQSSDNSDEKSEKKAEEKPKQDKESKPKQKDKKEEKPQEDDKPELDDDESVEDILGF